MLETRGNVMTCLGGGGVGKSEESVRDGAIHGNAGARAR